jgi:hypothetical protein
MDTLYSEYVVLYCPVDYLQARCGSGKAPAGGSTSDTAEHGTQLRLADKRDDLSKRATLHQSYLL